MRAWILVLAACRPADVPAERPAHRAAPSRGRTAPPAHGIERIAVTEAGDAVVTGDASGDLRLWSLDGRAEPLAIAEHVQPARLALGRDGGELVIAAIDERGGLALIRVANGAVVGRRDLPDDPGFYDVVGADRGVWAIRNDRSVLHLDARGAVLADLAEPPGETVLALATRHGGVLAGIGDPDVGITSVRPIDVVFGDAIKLRHPMRAIALSPSHTRFAGVRADGWWGEVMELASPPRQLGPGFDHDPYPADLEPVPRAIGFVDDDHVAAVGNGTVRWLLEPSRVPFRGEITTPAVFGDGVIVAGHEHALAVVTEPARVRYLGYRELGIGTVIAAGDGFAVVRDHQVVVLDTQLRAIRALDDDGGSGEPFAFDGRFAALVEGPAPERFAAVASLGKPPRHREPVVRGTLRVSIRDFAGGVHVLGAWPRIDSWGWDPASRVIAVRVAGDVHRWRIAGDGAATPLRSLAVRGDPTIYPIDSHLGGGVIAIATDLRGSPGITLEVVETIRESGRSRFETTGHVAGIDRYGGVWIADGGELARYRDGVRVATIALETGDRIAAVSHDGSFVIVVGPDAVRAVGVDGKPRWRRAKGEGVFVTAETSGDDTIVAIQMVSMSPFKSTDIFVDARSGIDRNAACAWDYGFHDDVWHTDGATCGSP